VSVAAAPAVDHPRHSYDTHTVTAHRAKMKRSMDRVAPGSFGAQLKALREAAGFTQEELATIAGLSVHAVSALERGERRRPHVETVRALSAALDLTGAMRDALLSSARAPAHSAAADELSGASLPLPLTALVGREPDLQTLQRWLADPAVRLVTLVGPGGVGKTRFALELARIIADEGSSRVVFVSLAAIRGTSLVGPAIAEALGLSDVTALDLPRRARLACRNSPTLLVLDNFEQLLDASPLVADLVTSVATLRVLVTSRAPLRVLGEREYVVEPLVLDVDSGVMSPADLARVPAVRLLLERVRDVQPDFRLTPANAPTMAAICRRLDALPLALELVAPWLKVLTPEDLLRRLAPDLLSSAHGPRDLPERQRTMNATVAWSYQLLDTPGRRVFRCLGVLPGRFPVEAVAAVLAGSQASSFALDEALVGVAALIDKSLLRRSKTSLTTRPLYEMLETVRAYAAHELIAASERNAAMEGLVRYCTSEASLAGEGLAGHAQAEWMDRVREDLENYRRALAWLIESGRSAEASEIAWALMFFWLIRGHAIEGRQWYERILNQSPVPPSIESRALTGAALMAYALGDLDHARAQLTRALALPHTAGDTALVAYAESLFGYVEHAAGNFGAARDRFASSVEGFRPLAHTWGTGNALTGMAWVDLATGEYRGAERLLDEATSAFQHAGPWFLSLVRYLRAIVAVRRGNADVAITLMRESLMAIRELQDRFAFVYALVPLAAAAALKGDDTWAARIIGARDAVTERTGATVVDHSEGDLREHAEREVRQRLDPDRWTRAYETGRRTSIDALLVDIDSALASRGDA
jgi:predicted ATPase/DNA-binding XRE family transcriptional regulator